MKALRILGTIGLLLAGLALLWGGPIHAQSPFAPTRFTVVDEGTAGKPDMLLIPGLSSSRNVWAAEATKLAPQYRLHLLQINGFAGQPAGPNATGEILPAIVEELHAYITANRIHPIVMGHSLGGLLALMLAQKYPADASRLIIVDSLPFYAQVYNPDATVEITKPYADQIKARMLGMAADQYAAAQPIVAAQLAANKDAQKLVAADSANSDRNVVVEAMYEDMLTDVRPQMASIKIPVLVLFAGYDAASQAEASKYEAVVRADYKPVPNVTIVKVDDSRHFIMYDQPEKFDAAVEAFLK